MTAALWTPAEREAWRPRRREPGSVWAEKNRRLTSRDGARAGPFVPYPYQRAWLDDLCDPFGPRLFILKKGAQKAGGSESLRTAILHWMTEDPGPVRLVLPDEQTAKSMMRSRILPMLRANECSRKLIGGRARDLNLLGARLINDAELSIGWAGSPMKLAADPIQRAVADEVDKWVTWSGRDAGPIPLLFARTKTYAPRDKRVMISTPTIPDGVINMAWERCRDRRVFYVPCPDCGTPHRLVFSMLRWQGGSSADAPDDPHARFALADLLEGPGRAWLECPSCSGRYDDARKRTYLEGGFWGPEEGLQDQEAGEGDEDQLAAWARARAYHISDLYGPGYPYGVVAAAFLKAVNPGQRMEFHNQVLGEAYAEELTPLTPQVFANRAEHEDGVVPAWATIVIASADTQADCFWWTIRAWGAGWRSRGLDWGQAESFEELEAHTLNRTLKLEGGGEVPVDFLLIDSGGGMLTEDGSRTHDVYQFVRRVPNAYAIKGEPRKSALDSKPIRKTTVTYTPQRGRSYEQTLWLLNVTYWKDTLAGLIRNRGQWEEGHNAADPEYGRQMSSEHKVRELHGSKGDRWLWRPKSQRANNHLWDCSVYQCAAAELANADGRDQLGAAEADSEPEVRRSKEHPGWWAGSRGGGSW